MGDATVDSVGSGHPGEVQLVMLARHYFKKINAMAGDPASA
ncbi:hypothetical protein [Polaromonas sp.]|nr:hypothetical protein [Polaromonas sp.]